MGDDHFSLVTAQLGAGKVAGEVKVPSDIPTCKTNLFKWLSLAVDELNKDPAGIVHCWKETELLRAWEGAVQAEAAGRVNELFPNLSRGDYLPTDLEEDLEAGFMGLPFTQPETENEWKTRSTGTSSSVLLLIETGLGAGVYSLGVKSVLYILPFL